MKYLYVVLIAAAVLTVRLWLFRARRNRRASPDTPTVRHRRELGASLGDVGMVATREIRERVRGRIFRVGTILILLIVAAAILIPKLHHSGGPTTQRVGVVGTLPPQAEQLIHVAASANKDSVVLVPVSSLAEAEANLRSGKLDFAVVNGEEVLLNEPATASSSPADPGLVQDVAEYLGVLKAYQTAGLTTAQAAAVTQSKPVPIRTLESGGKGATKTTSVIGLVLLFFMLTQYCTWILIGVMQEKSSRVVEVLLATVRPIELLGGKVLGIGLVALGQATLIVGFALALGGAVGSNLLHGTGPLVLASELLWLLLGYAFYCWVYAAGGSTAERQDQVQTLALPLSIPILIGYIFGITVASSGHADLLFKVLAYLPPTAPFCMSVLVSLSEVAWWQFLASVLITLASTAATAVFAAHIYQRAVLRTGGRVKFREILRAS